MNRTFNVIQGHPYWCQQKSRTDCCHNVQLQQCQYYFRNLRRHSLASRKLQIRRFQPPRSGLTTVLRERFRISRKSLNRQRPESLTYIYAADSILV